MSAPTLKLNYFPLRCRAEVARLVLHAGKREFVDNIVQFSEWADLKPKTPMGGLPYLEIGDEAFAQSMAIDSYLAREVDLYGSSSLDALRIEQIHNLREDLIGEEVKAWKEKDETAKAEITKNMNENIYPTFLGRVEKLIKENKNRTGSNYTVGDKLSLADIIVHEGTETLRQKNAALLDNYPEIKAIIALVGEVDGIKQYLEKRPVSDF